MNDKQIIETIGSITKLEQLQNVEYKHLHNTLVLRNTNPFPGVGGSFPDSGSVFIILRYRYAPEKINKINSYLTKQFELKRYPSYGEIIIGNQTLPCIRLKGNELSHQLDVVQNYLQNKDLQLMAYREINATCRIKIYKTFKLTEVSNGIYRDLQDLEKFYIRIHDSISWKRFNSIIMSVKEHLHSNRFDAALGVIYRFCGPENVIRIYDHNKSLQRSLELRKEFHKELKAQSLVFI